MRCLGWAVTPASLEQPDFVCRESHLDLDQVLPGVALGPSVWWELVPPEPAADFSDLIAPFMAERMRKDEMLIIPVTEHLERLDRGLFIEVDRREIVLVSPNK